MDDLSAMVRDIRIIEKSLGGQSKIFQVWITRLNVSSCEKSSDLCFQDCERECYRKLGKSVVAKMDLVKGTKLERQHLEIKVSEPLMKKEFGT